MNGIVATYTVGSCSICKEPQFVVWGGVTCKNGHGGAEPAPPTREIHLTREDLGKLRAFTAPPTAEEHRQGYTGPPVFGTRGGAYSNHEMALRDTLNLVYSTLVEKQSVCAVGGDELCHADCDYCEMLKALYKCKDEWL